MVLRPGNTFIQRVIKSNCYILKGGKFSAFFVAFNLVAFQISWHTLFSSSVHTLIFKSYYYGRQQSKSGPPTKRTTRTKGPTRRSTTWQSTASRPKSKKRG